MQSEIEALRTLKAQYCRFLDTRDRDGWRSLFADDLVVRLDMAPATLGGDPQTAPPIEGADTFVSYTLGALDGVRSVHHVHTPEIELTSDDTATGIWAMEDLLVFPDGIAGGVQKLARRLRPVPAQAGATSMLAPSIVTIAIRHPPSACPW